MVVWLLLFPLVAAWVAPDGRKLTFFWITLFFLGPLGIAAAAIAQPRPPKQPVYPMPGLYVPHDAAGSAGGTTPRAVEVAPEETIDLGLPPLGSGNGLSDRIVRFMRKSQREE